MREILEYVAKCEQVVISVNRNWIGTKLYNADKNEKSAATLRLSVIFTYAL